MALNTLIMVNKWHKGLFVPKHPSKYRGDPTRITFRSLWERKFMCWIDSNSAIKWWASEEISVPYFSQVDGRQHRYFPDFLFAVAKGDTEQVYMIEIKPHTQTQLPKVPKRKTKRYLNEIATYSVNRSKWEAAEAYCKQKGWQFKILTEYDLNIKKA